jgi:creatinine amidohydrolase
MLELDRMTYEEVEDYLASGPGIVILPVGATEEHGPHGPLGTDTFAAMIVARKVAEELNGVVAPVLPYGMSEDQFDFRGTVSLRPSTLALVTRELCENFVRDGYRVVLVISGNRPNDASCMVGALEARGQSDAHILYLSYQDANKGRLIEVLGQEHAAHVTDTDQKYGADGHGGSMELSLAMAYAPGCVRLDKRSVPDRTKADLIRSFPFRSVMFVEEYMAAEGFMGNPSICSAALGEKIAESTAQFIAAEVRRYLEIFGDRKRRVPPCGAGGHTDGGAPAGRTQR